MSTPQSIFVAAWGACLLLVADAILLELEPPPSAETPAPAAAVAAGALGLGSLAPPGATAGPVDQKEDIPPWKALAEHRKCWNILTPRDQVTGLFAIHIPKTAICSVLTDLRKQPGAPVIHSWENCYSQAAAWPNVRWLLTMLREPRAHVLSQYMECSSSVDWPFKLLAGALLPSFPGWVQAWADKVADGTANPRTILTYANDDFGCYRPVNFQTQRLSCEAWWEYPHADVAIAIQNMQKIEYVGIVEKYQESICLFHTKMLGTLPEYCDCTNQTAWSSFNPTNKTHSVSRHSISDYNSSVIELVDSITQKDRELYQAGLDRLRRELHLVEAQYGVKVLCE